MEHDVSIKVTPEIQLTYRRIKTNLENRFREFIDNSLQSFLDNKQELIEHDTKNKFCKVVISILENKIEIVDNSYGMNLEAVQRAVRLNAKKEKYSAKSLSEFGMGLKYAAIGLGNSYTIETKMFNSNKKFIVTISEDLLKSGLETVKVSEIEEKDIYAHYTKITITDLIKVITLDQQNELIANLESIYGPKLLNDLRIEIVPYGPLKYREPELRKDEYGREVRKEIEGSFKFQDKTYIYFGWLGVLKVGRAKGAGFTLYQYDRAIVLKYLPEALFKSSNSFQYQRIVGDIFLDNMPVDFNKSSFSWDNGLEEAFLNSVKKHESYIEISKESKVSSKNLTANQTKEIIGNFSKEIKKIPSTPKTIIEDSKPTENVPAYVKNDLLKAEDIFIDYEGVPYKFSYVIEEEGTLGEKWLNIQKTDTLNNYLIKINFNFKTFRNIKKSEIALLIKMATIMTISQLSLKSQSIDSHKFISKVNEIIKNWE